MRVSKIIFFFSSFSFLATPDAPDDEINAHWWSHEKYQQKNKILSCRSADLMDDKNGVNQRGGRILFQRCGMADQSSQKVLSLKSWATYF